MSVELLGQTNKHATIFATLSVRRQPPMWRPVFLLGALCVLALVMQTLLFPAHVIDKTPPTYLLPTHAFVIALEEAKGALVAEHLRTQFDLDTITVVRANNGSNASDIPLYTRHLIERGRHDHMQIGNMPMIGCLLSHADVWRRVRGWAFVFEEDVILQPHSRALTAWLLRDVRDLPWSIMMLQERSMISEGGAADVGRLAATCANCTWFGTRGYILTEQGAGILLKYMHPIIVQVDTLVGLVNRFDGDFHMYWTRHEIAGIFSRLRTAVWDGCMRCYVGTPVGWWAAAAVLLAAVTCCVRIK